MDVILLERIEKLGMMGDIVKVKPGYARNYLLRQKKALRANDKNKAVFEQQRAHLEALNLQRREEAQKMADSMQGLALLIIRQAGESGQLYGSVSGRDIADAIRDKGFNIERRLVNLDTPIKNIGRYEVRVSLHAEVSVTVNVTIARSQEEAERAAAKANAAAAQAEEAEQAEIVEADDQQA